MPAGPNRLETCNRKDPAVNSVRMSSHILVTMENDPAIFAPNTRYLMELTVGTCPLTAVPPDLHAIYSELQVNRLHLFPEQRALARHHFSSYFIIKIDPSAPMIGATPRSVTRRTRYIYSRNNPLNIPVRIITRHGDSRARGRDEKEFNC